MDHPNGLCVNGWFPLDADVGMVGEFLFFFGRTPAWGTPKMLDTNDWPLGMLVVSPATGEALPGSRDGRPRLAYVKPRPGVMAVR